MKTGKVFLGLFVQSVFFAFFALNISEADVTSATPTAGYSLKNDVSVPLAEINPPIPMAAVTSREVPIFSRARLLPLLSGKEIVLDPVLQSLVGPLAMPSTLVNFEGISNANNVSILSQSVVPPDTEGDVGPNHYVQWVNSLFEVWDKSGTHLLGPLPGNSLWSGFGGLCETTNQGDPVVLYDRLSDRWMMSQFAFDVDAQNNPIAPFHQCIAVSQTPDPTGTWFRYDFLVSNSKMNDYPKFGVWPDAYYMSANQFSTPGAPGCDAGGYCGVGAFAFDRSAMLAGLPATVIYFDLPASTNLYSMLPSHLNGPNSPPTGSPNYFVQFDDNASGFPQDQLEIWRFHADFATPANSTFTSQSPVATASFNSNMCNFSSNCIPQPGTTAKVDAISDRLMYRLQYRNFGTHETMIVNHTVNTGTLSVPHAGIRWYELRKTAGAWSIFQQGTFSPDGNHRWMGSIAMDGSGNIALGYSVSSSTVFPSIRYTGRLSTDPINTLPQGETTLMAGTGSQTDSSGRWGDYSTMSIDPVDDCTFWYTQEYYLTPSSTRNWHTRIGSFKFPSCGASACTFSILPTSQAFTATGGTGNVGVTAAAGCAWTAVSNTAWITITGGGSGSGNGTVNYSVATNTGAARTGTMTIAGQTFTVDQSGTGGTLSISGMTTYGRTYLSGVTLTMSGAASATTLTDLAGRYSFLGLGNGVYTVVPSKPGYIFTPTSRTVTLNGTSATGQNFAAATSGTCTFSILPTSQAFAAAGGTGNVGVTAAAGCAWTAMSNTVWITITGGGSGSGNGTVNYSVATNTGAARTGTMIIAGQTFTVNQAGVGGGGTFSISGTVTTRVSRLAGVTMTLTGSGTGSTKTDFLGNYTFAGLAAGTYTITPSDTGYIFMPTSRTVTINGANITGQSFLGVLSP